MTEKVLAKEKTGISELPNLEDVKHPVLKRAMKRLQEMQENGEEVRAHNRHHNRHDRGGSPYW